MKSRLSVLSTVVLALLVPPNLSAQDPPAEPGARVRVTFSAQAPVVQPSGVVTALPKTVVVTGIVATWEPETLVLDTEGGIEAAVPRGQISKLEVSRGTRSHVWKGVWIGAVSGFALGFGTVSLMCAGEACYEPGQNLLYPLIGGLVGIPLGAGIGAALGAASKSDRWEEVPAGVAPVALMLSADGSFGLALALRL